MYVNSHYYHDICNLGGMYVHHSQLAHAYRHTNGYIMLYVVCYACVCAVEVLPSLIQYCRQT